MSELGDGRRDDADRPAAGVDAAASLVEVVRDERRRCATLIRDTGSFELAEEAVQDAVLRALETWDRDGVPRSPRAWLTTAARRRAIDLVRRESTRFAREAEAVRRLMPDQEPPPDAVVHDDLLRLVFTCCHPSLSLEAQVALSLRTLCGLSTAEVARALLVSEATMTKRLTRARQKIAVAHIPYRVPAVHELPDRLTGVTATVYLLFNEGYLATTGDEHTRPEVAELAIHLGRLLVELMPGEASLQGLLALMLLQHARRDARVGPGPGGVPELVLLADQDRARWDAAAIREGVALVGEGLRRTPDRPDRYVVQAAIAACHALAPTYGATDWDAIVSWFDVLLTVDPSPIVHLNRAAAIAERDGPAPALALMDAIDGLGQYPMWHAARGELLVRLGRSDEAAAALRAALERPVTSAQRRHLEARLTGLQP